ncbi:MAG: GAF domain-containing protein [Gemmatimonadales bacterium]
MPTSPTSSLSKRELLALLDTANELTATDTLQQALVNILNLAGGLLQASAGSVILHDQQRNDLYFAAATGPVADTLRDRHIPIEKTKAGQVFATGAPIIENQLEDHYKEVDRQTDYTTRSMICVPLSHRQTTYGVMQLLNKAGGKAPYDERDIELATRFGTQATIAIHNARLFEQMLATSGLYSRPEVRQDLIRQMTASGQATIRERFTVLFADLRGFTQLCSMIQRAERIQAMLSDYIAMLSSLVVDRDGIVNKVVGDGLVAIYRTRQGATNAVQTALQMVEGFGRLRAAWNETTNFSIDFLDIGIGIATDDEMILGTVGDDRFRDFTVIGPAVNLAAALVDAARDGQRILCDMLTVGALTDKSIVQAEGPRKFKLEKPGPLVGLSYDIYRLREPATQAITQTTDGSGGEFDAFFSYRREGGSPVVRSVQQALKDQFRIFVDVDKLGTGHFDTRLLDTIAQAASFVVFLSPGSLDRCQHAEDWLRKEIAQAIRTRRNIVPVMLPGFSFPPQETLPDEIRDVTRHDAVEYSHRYFNAMVEKIRERLTTVNSET